MAEPLPLSGLSGIVARYEGYILDIWGVVHDGIRPFPQAIPALEELRRAKRRIWLLSNVPRRAEEVVRKLAAMGVTPDLYDGITTSGEAAHRALKEEYLPRWGRRCFYIGRQEADGNICPGLDLCFVDSPQEADFVFNHCYGKAGESIENFRPLLEESLARGLPMVCANPDRLVHVGDDLILCPGALADMYEDMGGAVTWFGKPHRAVYTYSLEGLDVKGPVLAIGDGMQTDIAGANGAGLDSALVVSGIHRDEMEAGDIFQKYPFRPVYLIDGLIW